MSSSCLHRDRHGVESGNKHVTYKLMATKATDALPMRGWLTGRVVITATSTLQSKIVQQASTSETSMHLRVGKSVSQFHQFRLVQNFVLNWGSLVSLLARNATRLLPHLSLPTLAPPYMWPKNTNTQVSS